MDDRRAVDGKMDSPAKAKSRWAGIRLRLKSSAMLFLWVLAASVIIAAAHTSLHLWKVSYNTITGAAALFFIPMACSFFLPIVAEVDDIQQGIYAGIGAAVLSLVILGAVLFSPGIFGYVELFDVYSAWVIQLLFISSIGIFPAVILGSTLGGAFATY